jgi:hypothetical protein
MTYLPHDLQPTSVRNPEAAKYSYLIGDARTRKFGTLPLT